MCEKEKQEENQSLGVLERTLRTRRILLSEEVTSKSAKRIIEMLFLLDDDSAELPIYFFINSPGGEVNSGLAIYDIMEFIRPQVYTIGSGLVASIASIIYLQPKKEYRLSLPNAEYLLHQPLGGMQGTASDLEIHANQILKTRSHLNQLIADKSGQSLAQVELSTKRDFWMSASQSMEWGLVGKLMSSSSELPD
jgi:ATP-dependent Clp protease, protease subunit